MDAAPFATRDTFLAHVDALLDRTVRAEGLPGRAARRLVLAGGAKRARPSLCFLLAEHIGLRDDRIARVASAIELIHTASLLHDDVLDESDARRGLSTANALYGNASAVLAGDYALACGLSLLDTLGARGFEAAAAVLSMMTLAAAAEIEARGDVTLDPARWRAIAHGKTAALFGLCGRLVGELDGDEDLGAALERACVHLGVAFQMADDTHDVLGPHGLAPGDDLVGASPSLVHVLAARDPALRDDLGRYWATVPRDARRARSLVDAWRRRGIFEEVARLSAREVDLAREAFGAPSRALTEVFRWAESLADVPLELRRQAGEAREP